MNKPVLINLNEEKHVIAQTMESTLTEILSALCLYQAVYFENDSFKKS